MERGKLHKSIIGIIASQFPGGVTSNTGKYALGFIKKNADDDFDGDEMKDAVFFGSGKFAGSVPDYICACEICRTIHVFEVEDGHEMGYEKISRYYHAFDFLDGVGVSCVLWVVDRYGNEQPMMTGDLFLLTFGAICHGGCNA